MQGIVDRLLELPGADGASLSTVDGELAYFRVASGADAALLHKTLPIDETLGVECLRRGGVTVLRATEGPEVQRCLTPGAGAIVLAPIDYDGETRGILGLRSPDPNAFDQASVETISLLATSAAVAMRNAEVVEGLARSEQHYRELHTQSADATLVSDADGRLLEANAAAEALFWYTVDELRQLHMHDLFSDQALADERSGIGDAAQPPRASCGSGPPPEGRQRAPARVFVSRARRRPRAHDVPRRLTASAQRRAAALEPRPAARDRRDAAGDLRSPARPGRRHCGDRRADAATDGRRRSRRAVARRARVRLQPRLGHRVVACRAAARAADEPLRPGRRARRDTALPRRRARRPRRPRRLPRRRHPVADRRAALPRRPGRRDPRGHVGHAERLRRAQRRDDASDGAVRQHRLPELARARDA